MKLNKNVRSLIFTLIFIFFQGLFYFLSAQADWPTTKWERSTPEKQNINPALWEKLVREKTNNKKYEYLHSLIIIKNGYLVFEEYFNGFNAERPNSLQSVSKSFTSAVIGMAIEQGHINGVDERILDFFPDVVDINNMDDRKKSMTLRDILTMRTGTDYEEGYKESPHNQLNMLRKGWDIFYLNRPMINNPGNIFRYDSGGVILLSAMLRNRTGLHVDAYAEKFLFPTMGINKVVWIKNQEGHPHTGGGLNLRPLDMAKFGLLYLNGGLWEGKQLVPAEWVKESFTKHVSFDRPGRRKDTNYGYLWWIMEGDPDGEGKQSIYAAKGYGGQYIFIIPEHEMIVVTTSNWINPAGSGDPIDFLYSHLLPAVHD